MERIHRGLHTAFHRHADDKRDSKNLHNAWHMRSHGDTGHGNAETLSRAPAPVKKVSSRGGIDLD